MKSTAIGSNYAGGRKDAARCGSHLVRYHGVHDQASYCLRSKRIALYSGLGCRNSCLHRSYIERRISCPGQSPQPGIPPDFQRLSALWKLDRHLYYRSARLHIRRRRSDRIAAMRHEGWCGFINPPVCPARCFLGYLRTRKQLWEIRNDQEASYQHASSFEYDGAGGRARTGTALSSRGIFLPATALAASPWRVRAVGSFVVWTIPSP